MSNVSPRSAYSFIPGKSLCMEAFSHAHRSPQDRSRSTGKRDKRKSPFRGVQNGLFRYRYAWRPFHMHTDLLRIVPHVARRAFYAKKKPIPRCAERAFSVSLLSSPYGLVYCAKLSLEANESAKSPSPSLAGQSVIVNQAGLLAPVHRSSASSQRFLPSDC